MLRRLIDKVDEKVNVKLLVKIMLLLLILYLLQETDRVWGTSGHNADLDSQALFNRVL